MNFSLISNRLERNVIKKVMFCGCLYIKREIVLSRFKKDK